LKKGTACCGIEVEMPMWIWIMIGVGSSLGLSLLIGLALARILGTIGRRIGELYETEDWAMLPPTRAAKDAEEAQPEEVEGKPLRVIRSLQRR
jgi:hypothetical protein